MGLYQDLREEPISRLQLRTAVTVPPERSVREVVQQLRAAQLGCAIVVDERSAPLGMFHEALLRRLVVENPAALDEPIRVHMTAVPVVAATNPIIVLLNAMQQNNDRFVCVLDEQGKVQALTGQKGFVEYVAEHFPHTLFNQRVRSHHPRHEREGA